MEKYNCEECIYRKKHDLLCFPCLMKIVADRRKQIKNMKEVTKYE